MIPREWWLTCLKQVLSPRQDIGIYNSGKNKKKKAKDSAQSGKEGDNNNIIDVKTEGETRDPAAIVSFFLPQRVFC